MTEFPRVGLFSKGYDCAQVDAFFEDARRAYEGGVPPEQFSSEQVRLATFELKNRGYNIDAVDGGTTGVGHQQPRRHGQGRGLAGPVGADHSVDGAGRDGQGEHVDGDLLTEGLAQPVQGERRSRGALGSGRK